MNHITKLFVFGVIFTIILGVNGVPDFAIEWIDYVGTGVLSLMFAMVFILQRNALSSCNKKVAELIAAAEKVTEDRTNELWKIATELLDFSQPSYVGGLRVTPLDLADIYRETAGLKEKLRQAKDALNEEKCSHDARRFSDLKGELDTASWKLSGAEQANLTLQREGKQLRAHVARMLTEEGARAERFAAFKVVAKANGELRARNDELEKSVRRLNNALTAIVRVMNNLRELVVHVIVMLADQWTDDDDNDLNIPKTKFRQLRQHLVGDLIKTMQGSWDGERLRFGDMWRSYGLKPHHIRDMVVSFLERDADFMGRNPHHYPGGHPQRLLDSPQFPIGSALVQFAHGPKSAPKADAKKS